MEILNANLAPLSAFEVLELVRGLRSDQLKTLHEQQSILSDSGTGPRGLNPSDKLHFNPANLQGLIETFFSHFESPCVPQSRQTSASLSELIVTLRSKFGQAGGRPNGLTKAERLQICDLAPVEAVEIHSIVEDCDSRFTEDEVEQMLGLVRESLSHPRTGTVAPINGQGPNGFVHADHREFEEDHEEDAEVNLGDIDDDDALVAEAREGAGPADQELDEVPD